MIEHILSRKKLSRHQSYRSIIVPSMVSKGGLRITVLLFIVFAAALFLPWTQTMRGTGRVTAYSPNDRSQTIDSPVYGRLGEWFVQEGSFVHTGDAIVEVFDNDPDILQRLALQRDAILKNLEAIQTATAASKNNIDRIKNLLTAGVVSQRDYEKAKMEYSKFVADEAKVSAELAKIDTSIARQSTQRVTAPMNGYIQRRKSGLGSQLVKVGDTLAVLIPDTSSRSVELWIKGSDIPFIHKNDKVRLQFEGWPAIQSFGWPSLALGTFGGIVNFIDTQIDDKGYSRLLIVPDPEDKPWPETQILRQGVRTYAWIILNEVSLGFELWRNFNGFPPIATQEDLFKKSEKTDNHGKSPYKAMSDDDSDKETQK